MGGGTTAKILRATANSLWATVEGLLNPPNFINTVTFLLAILSLYITLNTNDLYKHDRAIDRAIAKVEFKLLTIQGELNKVLLMGLARKLDEIPMLTSGVNALQRQASTIQSQIKELAERLEATPQKSTPQRQTDETQSQIEEAGGTDLAPK